MKKLFALFMVAGSLTMVSCGGAKHDEHAADTTKTETMEPTAVDTAAPAAADTAAPAAADTAAPAAN